MRGFWASALERTAGVLAALAVAIMYASPLLGGLAAWGLGLAWCHALWLWLPFIALSMAVSWVSRQCFIASIVLDVPSTTWPEARALVGRWRETYQARARAMRHPQIELFGEWHAALSGKAPSLSVRETFGDAVADEFAQSVPHVVKRGVEVVMAIDPPRDENLSRMYVAAAGKTLAMLTHAHYLKVWSLDLRLVEAEQSRGVRDQLGDFADGFLHALLAKAVHEMDTGPGSPFPALEDSIVWMDRLPSTVGGEAVERLERLRSVVRRSIDGPGTVD